MSEQQFEPACRRMEWLDPFYKAVWEKAYEDAIPISGTFELTPRCNFNCRMCYVHLPESEIHKHGRELSAGEWLRIAREAKEAGTTWLCITGGEPLMHPEFETIWRELTQMGFFITLQTNASLAVKYEKLFEECPPKGCKITLYGSNDDVYRQVCQVEKGFTRADAGIQMFRQMKIPVELVSTIVSENFADGINMAGYADDNHLFWCPTSNIKASLRGTNAQNEDIILQNLTEKQKKEHFYHIMENSPMDIKRKPCTYCKDYRLGYWITWNGNVQFCSYMNEPVNSVLNQSFLDSWTKLIRFEEELEWPDECKRCPVQKACLRCAGVLATECGSIYKVKKEFCESRLKYFLEGNI